MIRIPDVPSLQGTQVNAAPLNANAAGAPAAALGHVAQAIGSVGDSFQQKADQMQRLENERAISTARQTLEANFAQLQTELQTDQDPASRIEKARQFFQQNETLANNPDLSPQAREQLNAHYGQWASSRMLAVGHDAEQLQRTRTGQALDNEMAAAMERGDTAGAYGVIDRLTGSGLMTPEEGAAARRKASKAMELRQTQMEITTNPTEWLKDHPADKIPAGYDPVQWNQQQNFARSQQRTRVYDATSSIQDGMASGQVTTDAQIDALSKDLPPSTVEALRQELAKRRDVDYQKKISTPAYEQETIGKVSRMLSDYNPEKDGYDAAFVEMDSLTRSLPAGAARDELTRRIDGVRKDKLEEPKNPAEAGAKALDEAISAGMFGKVPEPYSRSTSAIVNSGFLSKQNLTALGIPTDMVDDILEGKTEAEKLKLFREKATPIWNTRKDIKAEDRIQKAAESLLNGETQFKYSTPEETATITAARIQADVAAGKAKIEYAQWLKVNPNASGKEIEDKIFSLAGEEARKSVSGSRFEARPVRGRGAAPPPGETSFTLPKGLESLQSEFIEQGRKYGVDPRFLAAISMHESAKGTSSAFHNKNNAMGVSNSSGPISFDSHAASIARMARLLASPEGPYRNANTLAEIAGIYAPEGAENDPGSLNGHWPAGVAKYLRELGGDPNAIFIR